MSFLFGRAKPKVNTAELPKQAKDILLKIETPAGAAKVGGSVLTDKSLAFINIIKTEELSKILLQAKHMLQGAPGVYISSCHWRLFHKPPF